MLLPAAALREHVQTLLQYLRACVTAGCEIGSTRHKELAKEAMKSILKRMLKCTTLDATAATSIIKLFKTELLVKEYRDRLVDAVNSKTYSNFAHIDVHECDCNQTCDAFYLYLTASDIVDLAVATSQHEAIQVLVRRMLALKLTHCSDEAYAKIAEVAIWGCKANLGNKVELIRTLKKYVENSRSKQRVAGAPTVYPESPAALMEQNKDLYEAAYAEEPPCTQLPISLASPGLKCIEMQQPCPYRYAYSFCNFTTHEILDPYPEVPMSPASSVDSSSTCLATTPPPRQKHGLQQTPPPPSPPPAGVTRQDLAKHDRLQVTTTPLTTASLDIPASLGIPAIPDFLVKMVHCAAKAKNKKTLASQGIPAIRKSAAVLARPGTPINPSMDAENKDMRPRALRGKANADAVLASTQQAAPGGKRKRLTKKTKDRDNKEEEEGQRLFKKRLAVLEIGLT